MRTAARPGTGRIRRLRLAGLLAAGGLLLAGCAEPGQPPHLRHAVAVDPPRPVAEFRLVDQHGAGFTSADLRDRWTVLFAGFTHCPDICPATLGLLGAVGERLGPAPGYRTIFVSVDPERDTPARLREYLDWFDPAWTGLTGPKAELRPFLDSLGIGYVRVPTGDGKYTVDHSTALVLIDPEARVTGYWKAPLDAEALIADLGALPRP